MEPITTATIASMVVSALTPLVTEGWKEVGKSAFKDAYAALKERLRGKDDETAAIEKFEKRPTEEADRLQTVLAKELGQDPQLLLLFGKALEQSGKAAPGALVNQIIAGKVITANVIGNVNM